MSILPTISESANEEAAAKKASYASLEFLIGSLTRKNEEVMDAAFALSHNRNRQKILWHLSKSRPKTSTQLSKITDISKGDVSKIINGLFAAGIVEKGHGARGSQPLQIRKDLRAHFRQHADHVERLVRSSFNVLSDEERRNLHDGLSRVLERLNAIGKEINAKPITYIECCDHTKAFPVIQSPDERRDDAQFAERETEQAKTHENKINSENIITKIDRRIRLILQIDESIIRYGKNR